MASNEFADRLEKLFATYSANERAFLQAEMSKAACYQLTPREKMLFIWKRAKDFYHYGDIDVQDTSGNS